MKLISAFLSVVLLTMGCSQAEKAAAPEAAVNLQESVRRIFERGNEMMDVGQYLEAARVFEQARITTPASTLEGLLLYNTALSYQLAGECQKAYDNFRKVVDFSHKDVPNLAVRAKQKMGEALGCLGQDQKAIVVLVEAFRNRQRLEPSERAELPAKIAALYARIGQRDIAAKYLAVAEKSLGLLGSNRRLLAETLFHMGDVTRMINPKIPWKKTVSTYAIFKSYLVRSAVLGEEPFSTMAVNSVKKSIDQLWQAHASIQLDPQAKDATLARRNVKAERQELLKAMLGQITATQSLFTPNAKASVAAKSLVAALRKEELKVKNELASESVGQEKTEEARKLEAIRREGRVKSGPTVLENKKGAVPKK